MMLSSTKEYIQALREGKYLLFLQWPQFITQHYTKDDKIQGADEAVNLMVFEWLNNGFCEGDVKKFAVLYAVHEMESRPLRGNLSYAVISISIALFQCMVYLTNNLQNHYITSNELTGKEINQLMGKSNVYLDKQSFFKYLSIEEDKFFTWVKETGHTELNKAFDPIYSMTHLRYLIDDYLGTLEVTSLPHDQLKSSRVSLIIRFAKYLNEQTELTQDVREEVAIYVNKIREMQPADFEEDFLNKISPPSLVDNTLRLLTGLGMRFFNILQPNSPLALTSDVNNTPQDLNLSS